MFVRGLDPGVGKVSRKIWNSKWDSKSKSHKLTDRWWFQTCFFFIPISGRYSFFWRFFSDDGWNDQLGNLVFLDNSEHRCSKLPHFFGGGVFSLWCFLRHEKRKYQGKHQGSAGSAGSALKVQHGDRWFDLGQKTGQSGSVFLYFWGFTFSMWCFFHVFLWFFLLVFERILLVHSILFVTDGFHLPMVLFFPFVTWQGEMFWTRWTS